ncbi:MAG: HD domain-containing protein [Clostridia bacterium]|nr:HD domain-containing protein [Clostridia bacterium]
MKDLFYYPTEDLPLSVSGLLGIPELVRLDDVGMHCGCEYTGFPIFKNLDKYSRYRHSLGTALITYRFTEDPVQAIAALLHDISTPVFSHTIDFLNGDYDRQESTELETAEIIKSSETISAHLRSFGIEPDSVCDYHIYPIADNDPPGLSADRLEYTLSNFVNFGFMETGSVKELFGDITVSSACGKPELAFRSFDAAKAFGSCALKCSAIYVRDEDRYSMQRLSEVIALAIEKKVIKRADLYTTETEVIRKLMSDPETSDMWKRYRCLSTLTDIPVYGAGRVISAKKRYIDPLVISGEGTAMRLSGLDPDFRRSMEKFLSTDFSHPVYAF